MTIKYNCSTSVGGREHRRREGVLRLLWLLPAGATTMKDAVTGLRSWKLPGRFSRARARTPGKKGWRRVRLFDECRFREGVLVSYWWRGVASYQGMKVENRDRLQSYVSRGKSDYYVSKKGSSRALAVTRMQGRNSSVSNPATAANETLVAQTAKACVAQTRPFEKGILLT